MKKPVIGLALSGGAALGFAHLGVIDVLVKNGIDISVVTGTSMGAVVGGAFAEGMPIDDMVKYSQKMTKFKFVDGNFFRDGGIFNGIYIDRMFKTYYKDNLIENLPIKFACVADDIIAGKEIVFKEGSLKKAVRASMNIPLLFAPIKTEGMALVDGGLTNNLPDNIAKEMGADIIIAVNVLEKTFPTFYKSRKISDAVVASTQLSSIWQIKNRKEYSDIELYPQIDYKKTGIDQYSFEKDKIMQLIEAGRIEANNCLPQIKKIIENYNQSINNK